MILFELRRKVQGNPEKAVAQGTIFDNGWCVVTWLSDTPSVAIYKDIAEVIAIHGHEGKTKVVQIAHYDKVRVHVLKSNVVQDYAEGIQVDFRQDNHKYMWEQREEFYKLFKEIELKRG